MAPSARKEGFLRLSTVFARSKGGVPGICSTGTFGDPPYSMRCVAWWCWFRAVRTLRLMKKNFLGDSPPHMVNILLKKSTKPRYCLDVPSGLVVRSPLNASFGPSGVQCPSCMAQFRRGMLFGGSLLSMPMSQFVLEIKEFLLFFRVLSLKFQH